MKIAIAQMNCLVGDIAGNVAQIIAYAKKAQAQGATLILTPELSLCGYPPEDLLLRADFLQACDEAVLTLSQALTDLTLRDITLIVGHPQQLGDACFNAASVLHNGKILATYHKHALPNYSVFDEKRYFTAGSAPLVFDHHGVQFGVLICADMWEPNPANLAKAAGAQALLVLNASPYHIEKHITRLETLRQRVSETKLAVIYANMVGGQDELVFDGASFVLDREGALTQQLAAFESALAIVEFDHLLPVQAEIAGDLSIEASVYGALKLGLQDYIFKNKFSGVVLGLSGGVDSALTLALAVDALGADNVQAVMMPSEFTAQMSVNDAAEMARLLGVSYSEIPIASLFGNFRTALSGEFKDLAFDAAEENLQARIRGMLLMALSNKFGRVVVTTGNKSEMAVGYCTLYGDMAGGFALLKDVPKTLVYKLCHYRNKISQVIPPRIITRPPSAELRENQLDQDSLPPYEDLDAMIEAYVEYDLSAADIVAMGYNAQEVNKVIALIDKSEHKRRQSPVGVRISHKGFGKDRRYPITANLNFDIHLN